MFSRFSDCEQRGRGGGRQIPKQPIYGKTFPALTSLFTLEHWVKTPSLFLTKENINDAALFDSLFLAMFCPLPITQSVSAKPAAAHPFEDYKEKVPL